jgi:ATP-binding cassette subfamily B protein
MIDSVFKNIYKVWRHISKAQRLKFKWLMVLLVLSSFAEILSIGAIFPFFGVLLDPEMIMQNIYIKSFFNFLGINNSNEIALPMTVIFSTIILLAALVRVLYTWLSVRLSFALGVDLSDDIYKRTLYQPYIIHVSRNSSGIINGIWVKVSEVIFYILMPLMSLIGSGLLVVSIVITLVLVTPSVALEAIGALIVLYGIIVFVTKGKLKVGSKIIAIESNNVIKNLQEGLNGIRDVLIDGSQESFSKIYKETNSKLRRAQGSNQIMGQVPNLILTSLGMILIAFLAYFLTASGGFVKMMPTLAALTLGLQRLIPNAQKVYAAWSTIAGSQSSLKDVIDLFEQPYPQDLNKEPIRSITFQKEIEIDKVSFRYSKKTPYILNGINLKIKKGSRIGFVGTTGCGKSTLLDIIMGLLTPEGGALIIDGQKVTSLNCRSWQKNISHVPQSVFLADSSIEKNIAFGVPEELIDKDKVISVAKQAQLAAIIESWPDKFQTRVGERGVQLSGGQCQRIGIARALYKNSKLIVLDEATSALDGETEKEVLASIQALSNDITIIMIAHRLNTLSFCDEIIELGEGGVVKITNNEK